MSTLRIAVVAPVVIAMSFVGSMPLVQGKFLKRASAVLSRADP